MKLRKNLRKLLVFVLILSLSFSLLGTASFATTAGTASEEAHEVQYDDGVLTCTKEEHTHTKDCYGTDVQVDKDGKYYTVDPDTETSIPAKLICGKEEHTHTEKCYYAAEVAGKKYSTLAAAIKAAGDGETVTLLRDVTEAVEPILTANNVTIDLNKKTLMAPTGTTKKGAFYTTLPFKSTVVITITNGTIDGNGVRGLHINSSGATVNLSDLTIQNCAKSESAAFVQAKTSTITNCTFINNAFTTYAVYLCGTGSDQADGNATVTDCHFKDNNGIDGKENGDSTVYTVVSTKFTNCEFNDNTATTAGALKISQAKNDNSIKINASVVGCTFSGNKATSTELASAGAIVVENATVIIDDSTIKDNTTNGGYGALYFLKESSKHGMLNIMNTEISGNSTEGAENAAGGLNGNYSTYYESGSLHDNTKSGELCDIHIENSIGELMAASDMGLKDSEKPYVWMREDGKTFYEGSIGSIGDTKVTATMNLYATADYATEPEEPSPEEPEPSKTCTVGVALVVGGDHPTGYKERLYKVKLSGPNGYEQELEIKPDGNYVKIEGLEPGEYSVSENEADNAFDGFTLSVSVTGGSTQTVEAGGTINFAVVNTYAKMEGTLGFRIQVDGIDPNELKGKTLTFHITGPNGYDVFKDYVVSGSYNSMLGYSFTLAKDLAPGEYTATYVGCDLAGYVSEAYVSSSGGLWPKSTVVNKSTRYLTPVLTFNEMEYIAIDENGTKYTSLQTALDEGGDIIKIHGDPMVNNTFRVTRPVTLTSEDGISTITRGAVQLEKLFVVEEGGALTLENITLNGGGEGRKTRSAIVEVNGGRLTLEMGATLQENNIVYNKSYYNFLGGYPTDTLSSDLYNGGGVFVKSGALVMYNGAVIENCSAHNGGGVLVEGGTFTMYGGTIAGNKASFTNAQRPVEKDGVEKTYYDFDVGCGGGVLIAGSGVMYFHDGAIVGNEAGFGGGVSVGTELSRKNMLVEYDDQFVMYGDSPNCTINSNKAQANGGGVFVGWGTSASILGGDISFNECAIDIKSYTTGANSALYGGGGIYVQGDDKYTGVLKLAGVEITDNNANLHGGGVAGCPYSEVKVYFDASGIIYGNNDGTVTEGATLWNPHEEVYITAHEWDGIDHPTVKFSPFMLGGGAYNWTDKNGNPVSYDKLNMQLTDGAISLYNTHTGDDEDVQFADHFVTVHIQGNTSHAGGGGIGTNGTVEIGHVSPIDDTVDLTVEKIWQDEGYESERPDSITFTLYQNGEPLNTYTMWPDDAGNWPTGKVEAFSALPKYDLTNYDPDSTIDENIAQNLREYVYTVEESFEGDYTSTHTAEGGAWTFTNTFNAPEPEKTSVTVNKVWTGDDDTAVRPMSITVNLLKDGEVADTVTLNAENGWSYTWSDLEIATYTVAEVNVPENYTATVTGSGTSFTITNTYTQPEPETIEIPVTKIWHNADGSATTQNLPESITVNLLNNGEVVDTATLTADGGWSHTFTGLDAEGSYTVQEVTVAGWTTSVEGYTITNTRSVATTSLTVNKIWHNASGADVTAAQTGTVQVTLTRNNVATDVTAVLNAENGWSYTFTNLPATDENGNAYTYGAVETALEGWNAGYTTNADGSVTITNTRVPISVSVSKIWQGGTTANLPESLTVNLLRDGEVVGTTALSAANNWSHTWGNLDPDGNYSVQEVPVAGWTLTSTTGNSTDGFVLTNTRDTRSLSVNKIWQNANGSAATTNLPESITVQLLSNGEVVDTVTLSAANGWAHTFTGLDIDATYSVEEVPVAGWTANVTTNENGYTITNTRDLISIPVTKIWHNADGSNTTMNLPESITVNLLNNGEVVDTATLTADGGWSHTFTGLDAEGSYTVQEVAVSGWTTSIEGYTITNTRELPVIPNQPDEPEQPEQPDQPTEIPDEGTPLSEIPDQEVPLAGTPAAEEPLVELPEEEVPLANVPKTGDNSNAPFWLALLLLSGVGVVAVIPNRKKKDR